MASYRFQEFRLSEADFSLHRNGTRIALEPKALRVLILLVSRAGRLVDKQELLESVWPKTFVEENTLTRTIGVLRRELGDRSRDSRLIETVPTRGYRFIAQVEIVAEPECAPSQMPISQSETKSASNEKQEATRRRPRATLLLAGFGALTIAIAGTTFLSLRGLKHERPAPLIAERRDLQLLRSFDRVCGHFSGRQIPGLR